MGKYGGIIASIVLLAALIFGSYAWLTQLRESVYDYRTPLQGQPPLGQGTRPLVQQVVLVIVGGLRYDASLEMPYLESLRQKGVRAKSIAALPTFSQPTWATLISGAEPEINGAGLVDAPYEEIEPLSVDDLLSEVKRAGFTSALAGHRGWEKVIPQEMIDAKFIADKKGAQADQQVAKAAVEFLKGAHPTNFLVVYFGQVNEAGQNYGAMSETYDEAAQRVDVHIRDIAAAMNLKRSLLIVTADHGHVDRGGYGGQDEAVIATPFVMVGSRALPGDYAEISQTDIAPTIAALLGTAVPSAAQGKMLFDMLEMDQVERAEKQVALASQRVGLGRLYLRSIDQGSLSEVAGGDTLVAQSSLEVKNYESAYKLAGFAVQQADGEMEKGRAKRIEQEMLHRLRIVILALLAPLYPLWRKRSVRVGVLIIAALLTVSAYHLLFIQQGDTYSASIVNRPDLFLRETAERVAISLSLGTVIILCRLWRERENSLLAVAKTAYGFSLILAYILCVQIAVCYLINGFKVTWYLPDFLVGFLLFSTLVQLVAAAAISLILPLVVIVVYWLIRRL